MKFSKVYFDREFFAEKLGVEAHQIAIAKVESGFSEVEITIAIDENANVEINAVDGKLIDDSDNLRRIQI